MTKDNVTNHISERERDNVALIWRWFKEVWNDRRIERIQELLSPDFISHYEHEEIKGINNWKVRLYETLIKAFPDLRIEIMDIVARGDHVVTRWHARGIHSGELLGVPPSGKLVEFSGMSWTKIVDNKAVENWNNWNLSFLFRQLLSEVKALRGLLPLCSFCKKIRDDKGYWEQVDVYISKYSEADITHGICPECIKKNYPKEYVSIYSE